MWSSPVRGGLVFFVVVASVLVLAGCGGSSGRDRDPDGTRPAGTQPGTTGAATMTKEPSSSQGKLAGTAWSLAQLEGHRLIEGTEITLNFRNGGLGGNAGCNSYFANTVRVGEGQIEISTISATKMACGKTDGGVMSQEQRYLRSLSGAAVYRVDEGGLELRNDAGRKTLLFEKEAG